MKTNSKKALLIVSLAIAACALGVTAMADVNAPAVFASNILIDIPGAGNEIPATDESGQVWGGYAAWSDVDGRILAYAAQDFIGIDSRFTAASTGAESYIYTHLSETQNDAGSVSFTGDMTDSSSSKARIMIRHGGTDWYISETTVEWPDGATVATLNFSDANWGQITDSALLTELNTTPMATGGEKAMVLPTTFGALPVTVNVDAVGLYLDSEDTTKKGTLLLSDGIWVYPKSSGISDWVLY